MREIYRSNDAVKLSYLDAALAAAGIGCVVFDGNMAVAEGSISPFQRRLMVDDDDWPAARDILAALRVEHPDL